MSIQLNGINCFYGAHQALFDITLDCPQGETLVLLGPSGAGKSSLLRVLNLLEIHAQWNVTGITIRDSRCTGNVGAVWQGGSTGERIAA